MNVLTTIRSQYQAALGMLQQVIERCPDSDWLEASPNNAYWQVAFHVLFYTHLYLQPNEEAFAQWAGHRDQSQFLGQLPWPPHDKPAIDKPYKQQEVLAYLAYVRAQVDQHISALDLERPSGFHWLPFNKLELQFYNIRHLQHHTGELSQRLAEAGVEINWVGMQPA